MPTGLAMASVSWMLELGAEVLFGCSRRFARWSKTWCKSQQVFVQQSSAGLGLSYRLEVHGATRKLIGIISTATSKLSCPS